MTATTSEVISVVEPEVQDAWRALTDARVGELTASYVLCTAVVGLARSGMAERLSTQWVPLSDAIPDGADEELARHLLRYLQVRGVVEVADEAVRFTPRGMSLAAALPESLIGYYVEAYGPVFQRIASLVRRDEQYGVDVQRDAEALGRRCEVLFRSFGTHLVSRLIREHQATRIVDLGCGTGGLVLDLCRADPTLRGVGLDIAPDAVEFAVSRSRMQGLAERASFVVADAFAPETWPAQAAEGDFYIAVGVLHEHFRDGPQAVVQLLQRYGRMLDAGKSKVFLLCEPELEVDEKDADFFLVHALTRQGFPRTRQGWFEAIEAAGLVCRRAFFAPGTGFRFCYYELTARR